MLIKCNDISIEDLLSIQKELKNQENEIDVMIEELIKVQAWEDCMDSYKKDKLLS